MKYGRVVMRGIYAPFLNITGVKNVYHCLVAEINQST
jgi:hypothetical protein